MRGSFIALVVSSLLLLSSCFYSLDGSLVGKVRDGGADAREAGPRDGGADAPAPGDSGAAE